MRMDITDMQGLQRSLFETGPKVPADRKPSRFAPYLELFRSESGGGVNHGAVRNYLARQAEAASNYIANAWDNVKYNTREALANTRSRTALALATAAALTLPYASLPASAQTSDTPPPAPPGAGQTSGDGQKLEQQPAIPVTTVQPTQVEEGQDPLERGLFCEKSVTLPKASISRHLLTLSPQRKGKLYGFAPEQLYSSIQNAMENGRVRCDKQNFEIYEATGHVWIVEAIGTPGNESFYYMPIQPDGNKFRFFYKIRGRTDRKPSNYDIKEVLISRTGRSDFDLVVSHVTPPLRDIIITDNSGRVLSDTVQNIIYAAIDPFKNPLDTAKHPTLDIGVAYAHPIRTNERTPNGKICFTDFCVKFGPSDSEIAQKFKLIVRDLLDSNYFNRPDIVFTERPASTLKR